MPVELNDAPSASDTEQLDSTSEVDSTEAPLADASIPAEGSETLTDDVSSEPSETDAADEPSGEAIDPTLAAMAQGYGLDPADYSSPASLKKAMVAMDRQLLQWYSKLHEQPQTTQHQQQGYQAQQQQAQQPTAFDLNKLLTEAYGPEVDPATLKVFSGLHEHYAQQFGGPLSQIQQVMQHLPALVQKVQAWEDFQRQQEEAAFTTEIDSAFETFGDDWAPIFGKGPLSSLQPHTPQHANRLAAVKQLEVLERVNAQLGRKESRKDILAKVLPLAFADHHQSLARRAVTKQLKRTNGAALSRPSTKTGKPVESLQKAIERNRAFDRQFED